MTVTIEYATIDPCTLTHMIEKRVYGSLAMYRDINEDYFEISVMGWLPLTVTQMAQVERILAPYV